MQRSLFTAVSGLRNHQVKLDVIGNNIANVNTVGFKSSRVRFQDVFSQTIRGASAPMDGRGGINPAQVGMGMTIGAVDVNHTQGSPQFTGKDTDLAIQGSGFFVVSDGQNIMYTRDGSFTRGADGYLVNSANGQKLLGWTANAAGQINQDDPLGPLNIPVGEKLVTRATENLVFGANLNSLADPADPDDVHVTDVLVYDSQGGEHTLTITYTKTSDNEWDWSAQLTDDPSNPIDPNGTTGSGTVTFNTDGSFEQVDEDVIRFVNADLPGDVEDLVITVDFSGLSQVVGESNAKASYQDGFPVGELEGYMIGQSGNITGLYTNGMVRELGQIAMAAFPNPEGLVKASGNTYAVSANSGLPRIGSPGTEGRGVIETSTLEMSNVDLSYEFTEMITTSRAFQANSRVITSSDEILQEVVNLKR